MEVTPTGGKVLPSCLSSENTFPGSLRLTPARHSVNIFFVPTGGHRGLPKGRLGSASSMSRKKKVLQPLSEGVSDRIGTVRPQSLLALVPGRGYCC